MLDQTWFDRAGDYHSDEMKVVERYTRVSPDVIDYEATITDPKTFSKPWKINLPLYKHREKNAQLLEYKCVPLPNLCCTERSKKRKVTPSGVCDEKNRIESCRVSLCFLGWPCLPLSRASPKLPLWPKWKRRRSLLHRQGGRHRAPRMVNPIYRVLYERKTSPQ